MTRNRKGARAMTKAIVLDANDVKKLIAEKYGVAPEKVIKSQYCFTVMIPEERAAEAGDGA